MNPRESFYREEFNILRASIIGDPSPAQIVELGNLIKEENRERDTIRMEHQRAGEKIPVKSHMLPYGFGKNMDSE